LAAAAVSVVAVGLSSHEARSQTARTIRIVVPLPPGGTVDILIRVLGEQIGRTQGVTVLIDNRPGAGTVIGTEAVSRAAPDGNTLLAAAPALVITPHLRKLSYDPRTGFAPICQLTTTPTVILVNSSSPYRTLGDLLDAARANPGSLSLASVYGSPPH